ncbi:MAG TPA: hypothetical protein V6D47_18310, partial [Oscillatoriaceae cyanobacterium]
MRRFLAAFVLLPLLAAPAFGEIVTLKDGQQLSGPMSVTEQALVIKADGHDESVPYASVADISLDDKPVYGTSSPWAGHDWLAWSA